MRHRYLAALVALVLVTYGCTEPTQPTEERITALDAPLSNARIIRVEASGFDDANNSGSVFTLWHPSGWQFLPNSGRGTQADDACILIGHCWVGTLTHQWGALGPSPFPEHNNADRPPSFGVMTNANFDSGEFGIVRTMESAIQTDQPIAFPDEPDVFLDFQIDAAFGTGQLNTGPSQNDFAVVEFVVDNTVTEVLRWSRDDLQPDGQGPATSRSRMDCGEVVISSVPQNYSLCTGWERHLLSVDQFAGQSVRIRIRIVQDGQDNGVSSFLAIDNVALLGFDLTEVPLRILTANRLTKRYIEVALLADGAFPMTNVDPGTLTLDDVGIARLSNGTPLTSSTDVNGDGAADLIARFDRQMVLASGTYTSGENTLHLRGMLRDRSRIHGTAVLVLP